MENETKALERRPVNESLTDVFLDPDRFEQLQRAAKVFSSSPLIPAHMREQPANCIIALALAREMGESPLTVMQSIYFVSGKAGWSATYMIARANRAGVFRGRINWRVTGKGDGLSVTAYAVLGDTGEVVEATADMAMASAEGWTKNAKYRNMPETMLRYRSATMLIRWYCPEVMLGYRTADELDDEPEQATERPRRALSGRRAPIDLSAVVAADVVDVVPEADPDVREAEESDVIADGRLL